MAEALLETPPTPGLTWVANVGELDELPLLYERFVQPRHGYVCRTPLDWGRMLADHRGDGGRVGLLLDGTQPAGYVLYKMADDLLRVREMVWRDQTGLDSLWKLLLEQARTSGINRLEWEDPAEDPA